MDGLGVEERRGRGKQWQQCCEVEERPHGVPCLPVAGFLLALAWPQAVVSTAVDLQCSDREKIKMKMKEE